MRDGALRKPDGSVADSGEYVRPTVCRAPGYAAAVGTRRAAATSCCALVLVAAGCGGSDADRPPRKAAATDGIEHMRILEVRRGYRGLLESWEHRPADGCWSMRMRIRPRPGTPTDAVLTVVREPDGTPRRVAFLDGVPAAVAPADPCRPEGLTALGLWRAIAASPSVRRTGTTRVDGVPVDVLTGPPDAALLGTVTPERSDAVEEVLTEPPGARMRYLYDPVARVPVRVETPRARVRVEAGDAGVVVPARVLRFTLVEEIPATPEALRVFEEAGRRRP